MCGPKIQRQEIKSWGDVCLSMLVIDKQAFQTPSWLNSNFRVTAGGCNEHAMLVLMHDWILSWKVVARNKDSLGIYRLGH